MPQLEIITQENKKSLIELAAAEYILGRDPTANIQLLNDKKVSRHHAKISFRNNNYWIEDLGSANGVLIDGVLINSPIKLTGKMDVEIGNCHLRFIPDGVNTKAIFQLVGLNRVAARQVYPLPVGETTIGRVDGNSIVINDKSISRFHTKMIISAQKVVVEDLGSSNGTYIAGRQIQGPTELQIGQKLRIGSVELLFQPLGGMKKVPLREMLKGVERIYLAALGVAVVCFFLLVLVATVAIAGRANKPKLQYSVLSQIEQELSGKLALGAKQQAQAQWDLAIATFEDILNTDPLNKEAASRLKIVQGELGYSQNVAQAQQHLARDEAKTAQDLLMGIPANSYYYQSARQVLMKANGRLAEVYFQQANAMNKKNHKNYKAIHDKLIEHLTLDPTSDKGKKLVAEIEDRLRDEGTEFISYQQQLEAIAGKSQKLVTQQTIEALTQRYGNQELVNLLVGYIDGDIERTKNDLNSIGGANSGKAKELLQKLNEIQQNMLEGQGAKLAGNSAQAISFWEKAIAIERDFMPTGVESRTIRNLKHTMASELYSMGEGYFRKQIYTDAFDNWYRGHQLDKGNTEIMGGFNRLNAIAKVKYSEAKQAGGQSACETFKLVLNITLPDSQWHQKAQEQIEKCR